MARCVAMWLLLLGCDATPSTPHPNKAIETRTVPFARDGETTSPTLLAEARLLARMRDGLESGDIDGAWDAVIDHQQRFPEGELWPDREVFAIAVLVQQGEQREARLRAEVFLETHENCAHGQRVKVLVAGLEPY